MAETTDKPKQDMFVERVENGLVVTRTIQVTLTRSFKQYEVDGATLAAIERGCSLHRVLSERLKSNAERTLRNAHFTVA